MSIYSGLSPEVALAKWYALRHAPPDAVAQFTPEEQQEAKTPGGMVTLAQENPAAWKLVATGTDPVGQTRQIFNTMTGTWDDQQVKGFWSHPESWVQLGLGAAAGGLGAAAALGGSGAAAAGGTAAGAGTGAGTAAGTAAGGAGILGTASKIAGLVGQGATALAAGNSQGKIDQNTINNRADLLALQRYQEQLSAAGLNLAAPQTRLRTSVAGDVAANAQPFKYTGGTQMVGNIPVPQHTGGLSPGLFSPNTRALGGQLSTQALADNTAMGGKAIGEPPALTTPPNIGTTGNILNTAGIVGGLVPLFSDTLSKYQTPNKQKPYDPTDVGY